MNYSGCLIRSFVARPLNATHALHFGALSKMRSMSHAGPSMQEMEAYLAPVAKRIAEYRLDLETNPDVLDKLASEGKISQHTADYFKKELAERMKSIQNSHKLRKRFWYIGVPALMIFAANAYFLEYEEEEHLQLHGIEHVPYSYLGVVRRKYPWGDGYHSLFFNKEKNFDPLVHKD